MNMRPPHFPGGDDASPEASRKDQTQRRRTSLPASLPPRGLSREQAAEYVGVSPSHFDKYVRKRAMPPAKRLGSRKVWDRKQLDVAFDALDAESAWNDVDGDDANSWD